MKLTKREMRVIAVSLATGSQQMLARAKDPTACESLRVVSMSIHRQLEDLANRFLIPLDPWES